MASGPSAYWTYGIGGHFVLIHAMHLHLGCSTAMLSWGWGKYTCDVLEDMLLNQSMANISALLMLMMAATVVDCNAFTAKIIAVAFNLSPFLVTGFLSSMYVNGHSMPKTIWCILGFDVLTFAIAAVMGLKGQVSADPKSCTFGALNKRMFGIGGILFLLNAGNLCLTSYQAMEGWGSGTYTCNTLESSMFVTQSLIRMQCMVMLIMVATTIANKTDLVKISAPMLLGFLAQLVYWKRVAINRHSMPMSVYVIQAIVFGSFVIAIIVHNSASARQFEPTGHAPLVSA